MTWFGALLPVKDGVAIHKALLDEAARRKGQGDSRSRGAIMVDTLVTRILAPHLATAGGAADLPLTINLVVPDTVLLGDEHQDGTGWVEEYGEVPGDLLREWIAGQADAGVHQRLQHWIRRLYQSPATGELVAMDKSGRYFDGDLAEFIRLRDRRCRTAGCGAPIRQHRPRPGARRRRADRCRQRPGRLRGVQLRQGGSSAGPPGPVPGPAT